MCPDDASRRRRAIYADLIRNGAFRFPPGVEPITPGGPLPAGCAALEETEKFNPEAVVVTFAQDFEYRG